jgi:hypothetical protein
MLEGGLVAVADGQPRMGMALTSSPSRPQLIYEGLVV